MISARANGDTRMYFHEERKYWLDRGDPDGKAPDVPFDTMTVDGVTITSRYAKRHELVIMARAIQALPGGIAKRWIVSMFCDSKATASYCVKLRWPGPNPAAIGMFLSGFFLEHAGGHNGISLSHGGDCKFWGDVHLLDIDPDWGEVFEED